MRDEGFTANPGPHRRPAQPAAHEVTLTSIGDGILDTAAQQELRTALRSLLQHHSALLGSSGSAASNQASWGALSTQLIRAGVGSGDRLCRWDTLAVAADELGRVVVDVPFVTSMITAAVLAEHATEPELATALLQGQRTAVFLTPYEQPFRTTPMGGFHDGRVWARVPGVAGITGVEMMLLHCEDRLVGFEPQWVECNAAPSLDGTRALFDVDVRSAHGTVLAEGDRASYAVRAAADAASAILAVEQASLAATCAAMLGDTPDPGPDRLSASVDKATRSARYAVQCLAHNDPHTAVAVATARMVCSTVSFHAAQLLTPDRGHPVRLADALGQRARGNAMAFGGPQWHRQRLAQLTTSPLSVAQPR